MPQRGEIYWADLGEPLGSRPGYRHPVLVVQEDTFNKSRLATVIVLMLTSNPKLNEGVGNIFVDANKSGLPKDSIINITQLATINKYELEQRVGQLPEWLMTLVDDGLKLVLGLKR
jgi:mRNA interferase MazF